MLYYRDEYDTTKVTIVSKTNWDKQLLDAIQDDRADKLREALHYGADINAAYASGMPAFIRTAYDRRPNCFDVFIEAGIDINLQDDEGYTALSYAACRNNLFYINRLLEAGADIEVGPYRANSDGDDKQDTPLACAAEYDQEGMESFERLVQAGASTTVLSRDQKQKYADVIAKALDSQQAEKEQKHAAQQAENNAQFRQKHKNLRRYLNRVF